MLDLPVKNGSNEKGRMHVDSVQGRLRILISEPKKLFERFVRSQNVRI